MPPGAPSRVWFVTGASSALGKAIVEKVLCQGDKVGATCREISALAEIQAKWPSSQLVVFKLDVTSPSNITAVFEQVIDVFGRLDVVYNNARHRVVSEEGTPDDKARRLFDVNFWGAVNVSREATKVFREVNKPVGGLLLQGTRVMGGVSRSSTPFYCASKFALEGYLGALSKEVHSSWNIRVRTVEFDDFATPIGLLVDDVPSQPVCEGLVKDSQMKQFGVSMVSDAAKAAEEVYDISREEGVDVVRIPLRLDICRYDRS